MSVQVSSVTVIDNERKLQNITGANGNYDALSPNIQQTVNTIDFDTPMMELFMPGDVTFSELNKATGKAAMLLLDTSSSQHTPSFSSNVKWSAGSEPNWSSYQHWQIVFQCVDNTNVRATAVGFTSVIPPFSVQSSFAVPSTWRTRHTVYGTPFAFPETACNVLFEHEPGNNRIKVTFRHADWQTTAVLQEVYVNYSGLTNITSVQAQYNMSNQSCNGDCNYSVNKPGPIPTDDGYNPGTYYNMPFQLNWLAQANPNAAGLTEVVGQFGFSQADLRIKIVCDQGTFFSTCDLSTHNIALYAYAYREGGQLR